jgi:hypothetical protein
VTDIKPPSPRRKNGDPLVGISTGSRFRSQVHQGNSYSIKFMHYVSIFGLWGALI